MKRRRPIILIYSGNKAGRGPIPTITRAFVDGLSEHYDFIPFYAERKYGATATATLNLTNVYYFFKHLALWIFTIIRYRPDIVHYPVTSFWNMEKSLVFLTVSRVLGCKTIGHLHGGAFPDFWKSISRLRKRLALVLFKRVDDMVVLSEYWRDFVSKTISPKRVTVVHNVIDRKFEESVRQNLSAEDGNILFVGDLGRNKGVYDIIEALGKIKKSLPVKLELVGPEGRKNDLENIRALVEKYDLGDDVEFRGPLYSTAKIEAFKRACLFILPSYAENFPLVILEAACAGLPIITTRVGAIPEFFEDDRSVCFVEPGNVEQIARAVAELLSNKRKREAMGNEARRVFLDKLSRKRIIASLDDCYRKVLETEPNREKWHSLEARR
jgi:glycosyltransferase involved in cell wall biosynthesis